MLTEPVICAILKLNCSTYSHAFHKDAGMVFVWKKRVTEIYGRLRQSLVLMLPTDCVRVQEMPCRLSKVLLSKLTS